MEGAGVTFSRVTAELGPDPAKAHEQFQRMWKQIKPSIEAGEELEAEVRPKRREDRHNRHFHKLIGVFAAQDRLHGQSLDEDGWKRLLIDAFKHDTKDDPEFSQEWAKFGELRLLPALNHAGFVAVGEQSRKFSNKLARGFITWLYALAAERNIRLPAFRDEEVVA